MVAVESTDVVQLGQQITRLRGEKGWSGIQLAQRARIEPPTLHRLEKGLVKKPDPAKIQRIAVALGVTADQLWGQPIHPDQLRGQVAVALLEMEELDDLLQIARLLDDKLREINPAVSGVSINIFQSTHMDCYYRLNGQSGHFRNAVDDAQIRRLRQHLQKRKELTLRSEPLYAKDQRVLDYKPEALLDVSFADGFLSVGVEDQALLAPDFHPFLASLGEIVGLGLDRFSISTPQDKLELYGSLLANLPSLMVAMDTQGRVLYANHEAPFARQGQPAADSFHPDSRTEFRAAFESVLRTHQVQKVHLQVQPEQWYETNIIPLLLDGQVRYVMSVSQDVSAQIKATRELEKANGQLKERVDLLDGLREIDGCFSPDAPLDAVLKRLAEALMRRCGFDNMMLWTVQRDNARIEVAQALVQTDQVIRPDPLWEATPSPMPFIDTNRTQTSPILSSILQGHATTVPPDEAALDGHFRDALYFQQGRHYIFIPIKSEAKVRGVVSISGSADDVAEILSQVLSSRYYPLFPRIAQVIDFALEANRLQEENRLLKREVALTQIAISLIHLINKTDLPLEKLIEEVSRRILGHNIFRSVLIGLVDQPGHCINVVHALNNRSWAGDEVIYEERRVPSLTVSRSVGRVLSLDDREDCSVRAVLSGEMIADEHHPQQEPQQVAYFIPINHGRQSLGMLNTGSHAAYYEWTLEKIKIMQPVLDALGEVISRAASDQAVD